MAKNNNLKDFVTGIADAIREKKGTTELINPQDFENEIRTIQTGSDPASGKSLAAQIIDKSVTDVTAGDLEGATKIGDYAFNGCKSLTSITIGNGVTSIGKNVFENCSSLTSITIPDSVTNIGASAFHNCSSLTSITIPDSVTSIGASAFLDCSSLTSVTIPDSVTSFGASAFYGCSGLESITIGNGVTSIGINVFKNCSSFTSVIIGNGVTKISSNAFLSCGTATESGTIYTFLPTTPPTIQSNTFQNAKINQIIVPKGTLAAYKSATNWSNFADKIEEATE